MALKLKARKEFELEAGLHIGAQESRTTRKGTKDRFLEVRYLEQVTPSMIQERIDARLVEDGVAPKTANNLSTTLSGLFSYATWYHGFVSRDRRFMNPVKAVKPQRLTRKPVEKKTLQKQDWQNTISIVRNIFLKRR